MARGPRIAGLLVVVGVASVALTSCGSSEQQEDTAREAEQQQPAATIEEQELEEGDVEATELELEEVDDSGVTGIVRVEPADGDAIGIEVELEQGGDETHGIAARLGSCADAIAPDVTDELTGAAAYTLADIEGGRMRDEATIPEDVVGEGSYALVVYDGAETEGDIAACVEVAVD